MHAVELETEISRDAVMTSWNQTKTVQPPSLSTPFFFSRLVTSHGEQNSRDEGHVRTVGFLCGGADGELETGQRHWGQKSTGEGSIVLWDNAVLGKQSSVPVLGAFRLWCLRA